MFSVKQIFLILSIIALASAAKKGNSARKVNAEVQANRALSSKKSSSKKTGFVNPNRPPGSVGGGIVGGGNRDDPVGVLIEPAGKACVPFDEARKWLTADYPGDAECRTADQAMGATSACCRVFSFTDTSGPQKWLLYDVNNQYRDLMVSYSERHLELALLRRIMLTRSPFL